MPSALRPPSRERLCLAWPPEFLGPTCKLVAGMQALRFEDFLSPLLIGALDAVIAELRQERDRLNQAIAALATVTR